MKNKSNNERLSSRQQVTENPRREHLEAPVKIGNTVYMQTDGGSNLAVIYAKDFLHGTDAPVVFPRDCSGMFANTSFRTIVFANGADTSKVENAHGMFEGCKAKEIVFRDDVNDAEFFNVKDAGAMFKDCVNLTGLPETRFSPNSHIGLANATDVSEMFKNCVSLRRCGTVVMPMATDLHSMFEGCTSLGANRDVPPLYADSAKDIHNIFAGCVSMRYFPDKFETGTWSVEDFSGVFRDCTNLELCELHWVRIDSGKKFDDFFKNCVSLRKVVASPETYDFWKSKLELSEGVDLSKLEICSNW